MWAPPGLPPGYRNLEWNSVPSFHPDYNSSLSRDISRSMRGPLSSDSEDCLLEEPAAQGSSSYSRVWTPTRRSTWGLTTTRSHHKRWRILSNFSMDLFSAELSFFRWSSNWDYEVTFSSVNISLFFIKQNHPSLYFTWFSLGSASTKIKYLPQTFPFFWVTVLIRGRYKV